MWFYLYEGRNGGLESVVECLSIVSMQAACVSVTDRQVFLIAPLQPE